MNGSAFPELVNERIAQIERDVARTRARSGRHRRVRDRIGHLLIAAGCRLQHSPPSETAPAR